MLAFIECQNQGKDLNIDGAWIIKYQHRNTCIYNEDISLYSL